MDQSPLVENASAALQPVQIPNGPFSSTPTAFDVILGGTTPQDAVSVIFTITFLIWLFYMVIAIYHWIRYGHRSWLMFPALAIHIVVSGAILLFASSGFH